MFSQRWVFFLMGVAFFVSIHAQGTASASSSQFLRNEPAEKTIWYGGLVAKMIFFMVKHARAARVKPVSIWRLFTIPVMLQ
jgi:hypothetical protein